MNQNNDNTEKRVLLSHGAGGILQEQLIKFITAGARYRNIRSGIGLDEFDDGATIPLMYGDEELVITSDGHTVKPVFFPGGDLGILAATGTINDLVVMGARPAAISSVVFIEEGVKFSVLKKIMDSFNSTLEKWNVALICGDTKVLPKGQLDSIIMATTGVGFKPKTLKISDLNVKPGDKIIVTGSIGRHGAALMANRENINLISDIKSDVAVLIPIYEAVMKIRGVHAMKDPTRGGLATALNEWAKKSNVGIILEEKNIPITSEVKSICDILGLNPYEISCEGTAIIAVNPSIAEDLLEEITKTECGRNAAIIGTAVEEYRKKVIIRTEYGGKRFLETPIGEPIPRVC